MPAVNIKTKLFGAFFIITLVSVTLTTVFSVYFFSEKIREEALANLRHHLQGAEVVYINRITRITDLARFLSGDASIQNFTFFKIHKKLEDYLSSFMQKENIDQIAVFDKQRRLISQAFRGDFSVSDKLGKDDDSSVLARAFTQQKAFAALEKVNTEKGHFLVISAAGPIFTKALKPQLAGVVMVRYVLNNNPETMREMEALFKGHAVIYEDAQAIAFTGKAPPIKAQTYHLLMNAAERYEEVDIRHGGQLVIYKQLKGMHNQPLGVLGISVAADKYAETTAQAINRLVIIMLLCMAGALLLGFILAQSILIPLQKLLIGVRRAGDGDLSRPIKLDSKDELGTLARAFNNMAVQLDEFFKVLKSTVNTLTRVSNALSGEKDLDNLLRLFLSEARDVSNASGSRLYLSEPNKPAITVEENKDTAPSSRQEKNGTDEKSAGKALTVPLRDRANNTIGVLELQYPIDAESGRVISFNPGQIEIVHALASQAAVAIENTRNYERIKRQSEAFERFVPVEFLHRLGRHSIEDIQLGDAVQENMAVLFSDIRNFTNMSELMGPQAIFNFLNDYLSHIGPVLGRHGGFIDKYVGDAIMALFPGNISSPAGDALNAALAMLEEINEFNSWSAKQKGPPINIGIGIHAGPLTLGTIGFESHMESTVVGDTVNLASRIESLCKYYGITLGVTDCSLKDGSSRHDLLWRKIDTVQVKGREEASVIYDVYNADNETVRQAKTDTLADLNKAIKLYSRREWEEAETLFKQIGKHMPYDKIPEIYLQRINNFKLNPPDDNWNGITRLAAK